MASNADLHFNGDQHYSFPESLETGQFLPAKPAGLAVSGKNSFAHGESLQIKSQAINLKK